MGENESADRIERMKEIEGGPGIKEILATYDNKSGYSQTDQSSSSHPDKGDRVSYSDSSN